MAKKTTHINIKKPAFPFGQEFWPDNTQPASDSGRYGGSNESDITAMDMRNVLPVPHGYSSFFGSVPLGNLELPPITEKVFTYHDSLGNNTLVALGAYGAMFSTDGLTWDETQVPTFVAQTATGLYKFSSNMDRTFAGFIAMSAAFTRASILVGGVLAELTPAVLNTDGNTQTLVVLPVTATNTYNRALSLEVNWDEAEEFNRKTHFINPNIAAITAGKKYYMVSDTDSATYTALTGDTVATVLSALTASFTSSCLTNGSEVLATYESGTRIKIEASAAYAGVYLPTVHVYEDQTPVDSAVIATLLNDEVMVDIPAASVGNLGYLVFTHAAPLTAGNFNLRGEGRYQTGLLPNPTAFQSNRFGDFSFSSINGIGTTKVLLPLTSNRYSLRQFNGAIEAGLTITLHDTGVPISSLLGSRRRKNICSCNMVATDVVVGRSYILQSLGQLGAYTAIVGDTISSTIAGCVTAYNLAGAASAVQYGEQLVVSSATDKLFFQPASLVTMTASATVTETMYAWQDFRTRNNAVAAADVDLMYSLTFTVFTVPTNVLYALYSDGEPLPITSPTGAWTDSNYQFTSAQAITAAGAGTKLMIPIRGDRLEIRPIDAGAGTIGDIGLFFSKILTGGNVPSTHAGPLSSFVSASTGVASYQLYKKNSTTGALTQYLDLPVTSAAVPTVSLYNELGAFATKVVPPVGALPELPAVDTFKFSMPVLSAGEVDGDISVVDDPYTPATATIDYTQYVTAAAVNLVTALPLTNGVLSLIGNRVAFATAADLVLFNTYNPWTYCIIKNRLYCYRRGLPGVLQLAVDSTAWVSMVPTFANMAEIEGISSGRGRMIMWDTTNSIYRGSVLLPTDFTPSISTRANVSKVDGVRGNVVLCIGHKDGFIIYATGSIVQASYVGGTPVFKYTTLSNELGILNTKAVAVFDNDTQFCYTEAGLMVVTAGGLQEVSPEASSYLRSSATSPKLDLIQNKYLSIAFAPETPSWVTQSVQAYAGATIPGLDLPGTTGGIVAFTGLAAGDYWDITVTIPAPFTPSSGTITDISGTRVLPSHPFIDSLDKYLEYLKVQGVNTDARPTYMRVEGNIDPASVGSYVEVFNTDVAAWNEAGGAATFPGNTVADFVSGFGHVTPARYFDSSSPVERFPTQQVTIRVTQDNASAVAKQLQAVDLFGAQADTMFALRGFQDLAIPGFTHSSISLVLLPGLALASSAHYLTFRNAAYPVVLAGGTLTPTQYGHTNWPSAVGIGSGSSALLSSANASTSSIAKVPVSSPMTVPPLVIPGGSFISASGTSEPIDSIYTKALILDIPAKNWGSCDTPFRSLIDFIPVNARSVNPITGAVSTKFTFQNLAKSFAIMLQDGTLNLCTQATTDSSIEFGNCGLTQTGVTRMLQVLASFATETGAVVEVWGSVNGEQLSTLLYSSATSANGFALLNDVLTGKWFRIRVTGRYDLKALEFSAENGGIR